MVTGTLPAGTVRVGDDLEVGGQRVGVRGLQVHGGPVDGATGPTRLAVNLRSVPTSEVPRGSHLSTPGAVAAVLVVDVVLHPLVDRLPEQAVLHVGTTTAPVRVRPLGEAHARLTLAEPGLPLSEGDRLLLRDPGAHEVLAGADVLATDPPPFTRRGAAAHRAAELATGVTHPSPDELTTPSSPAPTPDVLAPLAPLLAWLADHPFGAVPAELLADPGVTPAALAAAERDGLVVRTGGAVLAGNAVEQAVAVLGGLPDGFGPGDAARALGTSRRAAVALLERLDVLGRTHRSPDGTRRVRR